MKHYIFNNITTDHIPNPLKLENGDEVSPVSESLFISLGGEVTEDSTPTHEEEFEAACAMFRTLCAQIGQFIGNPDFHGGFGEMASFASSAAYQQNPVLGNTLSIQWSALNEECKYFGSRIGKGQPEWWYYCWELVGLDLHDNASEEVTEG